MIPGAIEFIQQLQRAGAPFLFLTNNSERSPIDLVAKFNHFGLKVSPKNFYTAAHCTADFLVRQQPICSAFVIGEGGLIMALQEAGSGAQVVAALDPLIIPAHEEVDINRDAWDAAGRIDSPEFIQKLQRADISEHARFAMAKDGEPERVLEKIRELEHGVSRQLADILDPSADSDRDFVLAWKRQMVFDIGYHYQQFDDFEHASEWFRKLTEALPGQRETRWAHYNLACIAALQGRPDEAMEHLKAAWAVGFADVSWMQEDGDLRSLRERPDFQALVQTMRGQVPAGEGAGTRGPRQGAEPPKGPN